MRMMKRFITVGLAGCLAFAGIPAPTYAYSHIFEKTETQTLAPGTTWQNLLRFGEQGWYNINVVRVDLKNPGSALKVLNSANGVSTRQTVPQMVTQDSSTVAAINGDFFYLMKPDSPMGIMIREGQLVSGPNLVKPYSALTVTRDGQAFFSTWQNGMSLTLGSGVQIPVTAYNKINWNYHLVTILDPQWGGSTPGAAADYPDLVEAVVRNVVVQEVRQGQPATAIPADGFVVLASGAQGQTLLQNLVPGDTVSFAPPGGSLENVKLAIGGGTMLVQNGQVALSEAVAGSHPRTAVGVTAQGDQLLMVTIDGRHASFTGMDGTQMAGLMQELGCFNAMMLDGGGSTTMMTRTLGESQPTLVNHPSDGSLRPVINTLAVSNAAATGELGGILLKSPQQKLFAGMPLALTVKGYDTAYQPMPVDSGSVELKVVEGSGRIEGMNLIADAPGTLTVEAEYNGMRDRVTLKVLGSLAAIELGTSRTSFSPGEQGTLTVTGIDAEGYRAQLDPAGVSFSDDSGLGTFQNGSFTAGSREGASVLRASCRGVRSAVAVSVGYDRVPMNPLDTYGPTFAAYPAAVTGQLQTVAWGKINTNALRLDYDFTGSTETTAAYITFANGGIPFKTRPQKIGVWVSAEQTSPHWIRGQIRDGNGALQTIEFKQGIDWTGWRRLEAAVPQNLALPATLEKLYVVEPEPGYKTRGSLYFDGLELMNTPALQSLSAEEKGGRTTDELNQKPDSYEAKWMVYGGSSNPETQMRLAQTLTEGYEMALLTGPYDATVLNQTGKTIAGTNSGYATAERENELLMFLNDANGGLRKSGYSQWPWLKSMLAGTQKQNILIFLPKPIFGTGGFSDSLEAELFADELTALAEQGKNVYVFYGGGGTGAQTRNGVRYIGTGKEQGQYISLYKKGGNILYQFERLGPLK